MKKPILFRRLSRPVVVSHGIKICHWEFAKDEADLRQKLNGEPAEIVMPAKPWYVRLWRKLFPLKFVELSVTE